MAQYIKQPSIWGRIGTGLGQGLAEQLPKEIERGRMAAGLEKLSQQKGLNPFQQFTSLVSTPGIVDRPAVIQGAGNLLRQQAIINSLKEGQQPTSGIPQSERPAPFVEERLKPKIPSATTPGSVKANLEPYIPPSGPEQEQMARELLAREPWVYPSIEEARGAIAAQVNANLNQSQQLIQKGELEEKIQGKTEKKLADELATLGAQIPGRVLSNLQQQAISDVTSGKLSADQAKIKYGKEAENISRSFSNIRSWGGLGLITNSPSDLNKSISALQQDAKKGGYQKEAADALIAENNLTPQFAYAKMYPVSEITPLNDVIKELPDIKPRYEKTAGGAPGLAGVGRARPKNAKSAELTISVAPSLARAMGTTGSPLSIGYELDKKGYDSDTWKQYLLDNQGNFNLSDYQKDELQKPKPSFFGWLNDWWLSSWSGVK